MFVFFFHPDERQRSLTSATQEGEKFHTSLSGSLDWLVEMQDNVDGLGPVSGEQETLIRQSRELEVRERERERENLTKVSEYTIFKDNPA